jgi:hypothetical protein
MLNHPEFNYHLVSETEMRRLYAQHDIDSVISNCKTEEAIADQGAMHHAFCCTITVVEYFEPDTGLPVATIHRQVYVDHSKATISTVRMFRFEIDVYILEPPVSA